MIALMGSAAADVFSDPWWDLRGDDDFVAWMRASIDAELAREVGPGHILHGRSATALARCKHCDDALFQLHDGEFARVHLTWSQRRLDKRPWPTSEVFSGWPQAIEYVESHAYEAGFWVIQRTRGAARWSGTRAGHGAHAITQPSS